MAALEAARVKQGATASFAELDDRINKLRPGPDGK
jgi:hypothetical protein